VVEAGDTVLRLTDLQNDQRSIRVGLVPERGIITSAYVSLRPGPGVDGRYLNYFLKHLDFRKEFYALGAGVRQSLRFEELRSLLVPMPDLAVQRAIAGFLDRELAEMDAVEAQLQRIVTLLNERRATAFEAELGGGKSAADFLMSEPGAVGGVPLKRLLRGTVAGGTPDSSNEEFWSEDQGTPWLAISDMIDCGSTTVTSRRLTPAGLNASRLAVSPPGTLLFAMYASLGKLTVTEIPATWNQAILGLIPNNELADARFLAYWLEALRPHLSAIARSSTQANLNAEQVAALPFPDMPVEEQLAAVARLDELTADIEAAKAAALAQAELLDERRHVLIADAVTGKLDLAMAAT
jgi:type I restriction enzyme S subunit